MVSGWFAVIAACVLFGSFGVPIKDKAVREAQVHPLVFQSYKTVWTLITSTIVALIVSPNHSLTFSFWGIVSGIAWVPAGIAAIISVTHCGLGLGQSIWSSAIVLVSFFWGVVVFHEPLESLIWALVSVAALCVGMVGMTISSSKSGESRYSAVVESDGDTPSPENGVVLCWGLTSVTRRQAGIAAALFNGLWGGSNLVPLKLAGKSGGKEFIFSFAAGSAIVNVALWLVLFCWRALVPRCMGKEPVAMPSLAWRQMAIPGMVCGCLWSAGNIAAIYAVSSLGQAVGYPAIQASMIVSGIWSLAYFREITGHAAYYWFLWALVAFSGVLGLSFART